MEKITCIVCPKGCLMNVDIINGEILVEGHSCNRGVDFAINEIKNPMRTLQTTVKTIYKDYPRLPVKTSNEVPKNKIFEIMRIINNINIESNVSIGDVIIENILDTGSNIVATSNLIGGDYIE